MQPHTRLRYLCDLSRAIVGAVPDKPKTGSVRRVERSSFPSTSMQSGRPAREFHDRINAESQLMVGALTLLVDGVADCFDVAARRDHAVNLQATSTLTRSVLEAAGQIAWLLERDIGGTERNRRYGIWLLSDLRQQRELLRDSPPDHKDTRAGHELVAAKESDLIAQLQLIGLSVRPSSADGKKAAVLLTNEGKPEGRPSMGTMVDLVAPSGAAYPLLSVAAHSYRLGILTGVKHRDSEDGGLNVDLVGFGVPAKLALGMTATALVQTSHLLAEWTGVDATKLNPELRRLARQMGFTPPR